MRGRSWDSGQFVRGLVECTIPESNIPVGWSPLLTRMLLLKYSGRVPLEYDNEQDVYSSFDDASYGLSPGSQDHPEDDGEADSPLYLMAIKI